MEEAMQTNCGRKLPQFSTRIEMPGIPKAFINQAKIKLVLCHTAEEFGYEEQQALYHYCFYKTPIGEIAEKVGLSQNHVKSVLVLYSERLASKLDLFKRAIPYNADDLLSVNEILLQYHSSNRI